MSLIGGHDAAVVEKTPTVSTHNSLDNKTFNVKKVGGGGWEFVNSVCIDLNIILTAASQAFLFEDTEKQTKTQSAINDRCRVSIFHICSRGADCSYAGQQL